MSSLQNRAPRPDRECVDQPWEAEGDLSLESSQVALGRIVRLGIIDPYPRANQPVQQRPWRWIVLQRRSKHFRRSFK